MALKCACAWKEEKRNRQAAPMHGTSPQHSNSLAAHASTVLGLILEAHPMRSAAEPAARKGTWRQAASM
eukprot:1882587-Amphidinium_carterae.4